MTSTDPVCGMPVPKDGGLVLEYSGRTLRFCTEFCKEQFLRHPHAYGKPSPLPARVAACAERRIAYLSMEIALENSVPTYSGGLGVLAGDTLRSLADLKIPLVGLSLVHHKAYFKQDVTRKDIDPDRADQFRSSCS